MRHRELYDVSLTIVWCGPRHCLVLVRRHKRGWRQQLSGQRYYSGMMTAALSVTNPLSSTATVLTVEHRFIFPNHQVKKINPIKLQWFLPLLIATAYMGLVWLFIPDIESVTNRFFCLLKSTWFYFVPQAVVQQQTFLTSGASRRSLI